MKNELLKKIAGSLIRTIAAALGAWLATAGGSDPEQITGALVVVLTAAWSIWEKNDSQTKIETALTLPEGSTRADLKAGG